MIFPPISLLSHHHIDSFRSHRSLYNVLPLCDKHGNRPSFLGKLYALDSSLERTRPQFARVYLSWHLGRVHEVVCVWLTTPSLHKYDSHALPLPSPCFAQFVHLWAFHAIPKCVVLLGFCKVPIPKVSYTSVTVLLSSRQTMFLPCEVSYQHFRLHWTSEQPFELFCGPC